MNDKSKVCLLRVWIPMTYSSPSWLHLYFKGISAHFSSTLKHNKSTAATVTNGYWWNKLHVWMHFTFFSFKPDFSWKPSMSSRRHFKAKLSLCGPNQKIWWRSMTGFPSSFFFSHQRQNITMAILTLNATATNNDVVSHLNGLSDSSSQKFFSFYTSLPIHFLWISRCNNQFYQVHYITVLLLSTFYAFYDILPFPEEEAEAGGSCVWGTF